MKIIFIWLCLASTVLAANPDFTPPMDALKIDGVLVISDGSSVYEFNSDGTFHSYPVGMSGRVLDGTWTSEGTITTTFTVTAANKWMNGFQPPKESYRIVFGIYPGQIRPADELPFRRHPNIFKGYFIIDELTKVQNQENAQQSVPGYPPQGVGSPEP